jgi:hypothetical protein
MSERKGDILAEHSLLDIFIPEASDLDIEEALGSSGSGRGDDDGPLIAAIPQRSLLFFGKPMALCWDAMSYSSQVSADEKLEVYIVLRTACTDEAPLKEYVSRLCVALEAHAISTVSGPSAEGPSGPGGNQTRDIIWSGRVNVADDPIIVLEDLEESHREDGKSPRSALLIWKTSIFLSACRVIPFGQPLDHELTPQEVALGSDYRRRRLYSNSLQLCSQQDRIT